MPFRPTTLQRLTNCLASRVRSPPCKLNLPRHQRSHDLIAPRCFSTTFTKAKKIDFTQKADETANKDDVSETQKKGNAKVTRKNASKTSSLRSIAVEAQRSRTFVKSRGRQRFVDPDAETKVTYITMCTPFPTD